MTTNNTIVTGNARVRGNAHQGVRCASFTAPRVAGLTVVVDW